MEKNAAQIVYEHRVDIYKLQMGLVWKNPQHKTFIDVLKNTIPASDRGYDPSTYTWTFQPNWFPVVKLLVEAVFHPIYIYTKEQYEESVRGQTGNIRITCQEYKNRFNRIIRDIGITTQLDDGTSYGEANKIYRKVALLLHPDRNPNNSKTAEQMSIVNECWSSIKEEYLKKQERSK